jgi:hypothetical protein
MSESKVPYRAGGGPVVPLTLAVTKPDLAARAHAMLESLLPSSRNLEYIAAPFTSDNEEIQRARLRVATQYAARLTADSSNVFSPLTRHGECVVCGQAATLTGDWCSVCATFVAEYRSVGSGNLV